MSGPRPAPQSQPTPIRPTSDPGPEHRHQSIPAPLGRLIGRDTEVAALTALLLDDDARLITLTGPGGVGKTRLAMELGGRVASQFDGRVTYIELAPLSDPGRVLPAIAQALDVPDIVEDHIERQIAAWIKGARHLLIVDNFEHVAAAGPAIGDLARQCPNVTVLITSRLRLRLQGEHEYPVLPLPLPEPHPGEDLDPTALSANPAVALFVQRAGAAKPGFALTPANASAVALLCHRLDGLPLAIELAAARSGVLSPQSILARLTGRLQLLSDGPVDAPLRLRGMRDAVAWSLDLLDADASALFRRMAVFPGETSVEEVETVAGNVTAVPALASLVDAALLQQSTMDDGTIRFRMLETVREVARERLDEAGETDATYGLLAERYRQMVVAAAPEVIAGRAETWFSRLEAEDASLHAAIDWAIRRGDATLALNLLIGPVWFLWSIRGRVRSERHRLESALALVPGANPPVDPGLRTRALFTDGLLAMDTGNSDDARVRFEGALALCQELDNPDTISLPILTNLALIDNEQGRYADSHARLETVLTIRRGVGNPAQIGGTLVNLGATANLQGDFAAAKRYLEEALPLIRRTGERRNLGYCLNNLGETLAYLGDDAEALVYFDQALGVFRQADIPVAEGIALVNMAAASLRTGDIVRAAAALIEALNRPQEPLPPVALADALDGAAAVTLTAGQPRETALFLAAAASIRAAAHLVPSPVIRRRADRATAGAKAGLGRAGYEAAAAAARTMDDEAIIARAVRTLADLAPTPLDATDAADGSPPIAGVVPAEPVALTKRQRDVLRLLVAGLTDPEIGEELGIGVRTVESHVSALLAKLRVHARTAAVAYAVRHGLG